MSASARKCTLRSDIPMEYDPSDENIHNVVEEFRDIFGLNESPEALAMDAIDQLDGYDLDDLPVYIIICHSALNINLNLDRDGTLRAKRGYHSSYHQPEFQSPCGPKFVVYPSPPGAWGLLCTESCRTEENDHILRLEKQDMLDCLFSKYPGPRIASVPHNEEQELDPHFQKMNGGFFLPSSIVPEKDQSFHGSTLTHDGFGIVKLTNPKLRCDREHIQRRIQQAVIAKDEHYPSDFIRAKSKKYFIIDEGEITKNDEEIRKLLYRSDEIQMSEIVHTGDPGVYITLSCSGMNINLVSEKDREFQPIEITAQMSEECEMGGWVKLRRAMQTVYEEVFDFNKAAWDIMAGDIGFDRKPRKNCSASIQISETPGDECIAVGDFRKAAMQRWTRRRQGYASYLADEILSTTYFPRASGLKRSATRCKKRRRSNRKLKKHKKRTKRKQRKHRRTKRKHKRR